ncbi:MAG: TauD/TfdA family dioxygenase [Proteobacteria bacterium]|nr:TauD/TfdA family dioxygenase [Pseudomonadota bacterium]
MELNHLTPLIGSEVLGADLSSLDDIKAGWIRKQLIERQVLVFRDQQLNREQHKAVARLFGTGKLHVHALVPAGQEDPEYAPIRTTPDSNYAIGEGWHTDVSCDPAPIAASALYMREMPEIGGGDTMFASMTECYKRLSDPLRDLAHRLTALHDGAKPWRDVYAIDPPAGMPYNRTVHPLVIAHPDSGLPVLWLNRGFVTRIEGVTPLEGRHLLELYLNHIETCLPAQVRVKWAPDTLVLWDNVATQHHAVWDYHPYSRYAERVSVIGSELRAA